jgi:hypothetical protein
MTRVLVAGLLAMAAGAQSQAQPQGRGGPPNWRLVGAAPSRSAPAVKNAPFSADVTTETTVVLGDGNHIRQTGSFRLYRDSEGRTRRDQSLNSVGGLASNADLPPVVFINDPVAGVNYALSPSSKTGTRSAAGGRGFGGQAGNRAGRSGPPPDGQAMGRRMRGGAVEGNRHVKTESLGQKTIEGVLAEGTRTTVTIPPAQMGNELPLQTVLETWYSPDLQISVLSKRSDPRTGETVTRYTNISRSEPVHSLFEAPADYKIADSESRGPRGGSK